MKYMKILGLGLLVAVTLGLLKDYSRAQVSAPVGDTTLQSSQLILFYDQFTDDERQTFIQVTNASSTTPVDVHVQIFRSYFILDVDENEVLVSCEERDFNDSYTENDTHVYNLSDLKKNEGGSVAIDIDNTKGFVVITPVDAPGTLNAIAFNHLFGTSVVVEHEIEDNDSSWAYRTSAMGRQAVDFSNGLPLVDGTLLNGTTGGYVLLQPEVIKFNFNEEDSDTESDIVSITFSDDYETALGYSAVPAVSTLSTLIFDEFETLVSCGSVTQDCFFDIGINDAIPPDNSLAFLFTPDRICVNNNFDVGWVKSAVTGLSFAGLQNEVGLAGLAFEDGEDSAGASWMYTEGEEVVPTPTPTPTPIVTVTPTPIVTVTPTPTPTGPECTEDDDCPLGEICGDFVEPDMGVCIDGCTAEHGCPIGQSCVGIDPDTGIGQCVTAPVSFPPRQGSGNSCTSIAGAAPVQLGTAMANILIPLVPALAIGLRVIRRRKKGQK